jgi:two-component system, cell cycle response regulator
MQMKKILVVEDNALNMKLVRGLLGLGPYRMLEAVDAEDALAIAGRELPDLILMDIQLPGMDGLTATRKLKADDRLGHIPVVALTSYAMAGDETKAAQAGCNGYITKPIDTRSFIGKLEAFFSPNPSAETAEADPTISDRPTATRVRRQPLVLLVDDEPKNVKLLAAKLAGQPYTIRSAFNGADALEMVSRHEPDLILLDVMMPGMDGYEVTRRLKADEKSRAIPVIMITALDGSEDKAKGMAVGAEEFLTKPVNTAELLARIGSMLKLKQFKEQLTSRHESKFQFGHAAVNTEGITEASMSRVLLVEDDAMDIKLLEPVLSQLSGELRVASSAEAALEIIEAGGVDLLLLDVMLPGMSGFDLCQRLKRDPEHQDIQVVLITCLDDLESRIKGVELGADDFLVKPVECRELAARVKVLLEKKRYIDNLRSDYEEALTSAINDGLTGLYNRTYFMRFLEQEILRSNRQGYPIGLLMIDLDDFKQVNDTLGHLAGDKVLQDMARLLRNSVREIDLAARYGGEEFAVVFPYADSKGLHKAAVRVLSAIRAHSFFKDPHSSMGPMTASMGLALYPQHAASAAELIEAADTMLYEAKQSGKNRLRVFGDTR